MMAVPRTMAIALAMALAASRLAAQQHEPMHHPAPADTSARRAPRDTAMGHMPGMGRRAPAEKSGRRAPPDTAMAHMPGMGRPGAANAPMHQMPGMGPGTTIGIPDSRDASGTAWQPDVSPMYALHAMAGAWSLMLHGNAFVQYIDEGGDRGARQLGSVNWFMGMARRQLAGGTLGLRAMASLEPLTVGDCGHPDLLATGEFCKGEPIHDRQHPHDAFMEIAALYERALTRTVAVEVYGGPAGEPALGPVAYPHRLSAMWNPIAPISHHWQDATHIAFGVATAGVYGRAWKLEGSAFNGREPDQNRWNLDLGALDSYSGRVWLLPTPHLALQASTGYLRDAERNLEGARTDVHRTTASLEYHAPLSRGGMLATTLVWGQNRAHGLTTGSGLLEGSLDLDGRNVLFGRGELVEKTGEDLALESEFPGLAQGVYRVGKASLGYTRQFGRGALRPAIGASVSMSLVPRSLKPAYGTTASPGFAVFASVRAAPMRAMPQHAMSPPQPSSVTAGRARE